MHLIKKLLIGLLTNIVNSANHAQYITLNNHQCMTQAILINIHPNEYIQGLRYYPFAVNLDKCVGSFNTHDDLSNRVCVPNKTEDLNLNVLNIITGI